MPLMNNVVVNNHIVNSADSTVFHAYIKNVSMNARKLSEHSYFVQGKYNWHIVVCVWVKIVVL